MKAETYFKKAMEEENLNIRLAKLESICFKTIPYSEIWEKAKREASKLREQGFKYWDKER